jgi:acetyl esterase/lipase
MIVSQRVWAGTPPTATDHYGPNWRHELDLYVPQGRPGPFPVVVYIHGGGWFWGDKSLVEPWVDELLARGFVVASINYRYSTQAPFPAQLHDCKGAVRWLRAHADVYDLDVDRFGVLGQSAGGHLAALLGTTSDVPQLEGAVGGNLDQSSTVQAVVDTYGPADLFALSEYSQQRGFEVTALVGHDIYDIIEHVDDPEYAALVALVNNANPATHATTGDAPTYLAHGENDLVVPISQSEGFSDSLTQAEVFNTLRVMPNVAHDLPDEERPAIYDFFEAKLAVDPLVFAIGGANANDNFGAAVTIIGDVNGDDIRDFVVGAPLNDDNGADAGRVTVHSGVDGATLRIVRGSQPGDRFGSSVATVGDVNGDDVPDFAVGAPRSNINGVNSGRVDVFAGGTWTRLLILRGEATGDQMGTSVTGADVDGDGVMEILGGAPLADGLHIDCGRVLAWSANQGVILRKIKGAGAGDRFGWSLANAGDVDGDNRDDVVIGVPRADTGGMNSGKVDVWGWNGTTWLRRATWRGQAGDQVGFAVAGIGDADGDGLADIAAGAPHARSAGGARCGRVLVLSPATHAVLAVLGPPDAQAGEQFGAALAHAGDVDGDGAGDVLASAWHFGGVDNDIGRVVVLSSAGDQLGAFTGFAAGAGFGWSIACDDLDGDGACEAISGAPMDYWGSQRPGALYTLTLPAPE